jgi:hypothetical protein
MRIRHATSLVVAGFVVCLFSMRSSAQTYQGGGNYQQQNYPAFPASGGGGGYGWGGYNNGGTVAGSYLNGMANVVRSAGYANVMNSIAAQNYEQAYSADLDNRLKYTNTYFEMRRTNKAARAEESGPRPSTAELTQYAAQAAPKRLTSSELDPVTGEINWPAVFNDQRYAKTRDIVERLFTQRQATTGSSGDYRAITGAIDSLRGELSGSINDYSPATYVEARKFLDSLQYEARFVTS